MRHPGAGKCLSGRPGEGGYFFRLLKFSRGGQDPGLTRMAPPFLGLAGKPNPFPKILDYLIFGILEICYSACAIASLQPCAFF
jgi:hypothetical protein